MLPTALLEKVLDTEPLLMLVCLFGNARWSAFYCGLLLLWKALSEVSCWPPGWAQPCGQRSLLSEGMR